MNTEKNINEKRKAAMKQCRIYAAQLCGNDYIVVVLRDGSEYIISDSSLAEDLKGIKYNQVSYINYWYAYNNYSEMAGISEYIDFGYNDDMVSADDAFNAEMMVSSERYELTIENLATGISNSQFGSIDKIKDAIVASVSNNATANQILLFNKIQNDMEYYNTTFLKAADMLDAISVTDNKYYGIYCIKNRMSNNWNELNDIVLDAINISMNTADDTDAISADETVSDDTFTNDAEITAENEDNAVKIEFFANTINVPAVSAKVLSIEDSEHTDVISDTFYDDDDYYD